ncbi:MAG: hypothetical protein IH583_12670, partial [Candidatus Aminicenantes bacterium]|nr:hypothetical protein [Candidatus Aminicenantes bacterium]
MNKRIFIIFFALTAHGLSFGVSPAAPASIPAGQTTAAQPPDGEAILRRADDNMGSDNKITTSVMTIHGRRGSRSVKSKSWIRGRTQSFTEYLDPPREKGTKMLKLEDQLWTYTPSS